MAKKPVAVFVILSFSLLTCSCFPRKVTKAEEVEPSKIAGRPGSRPPAVVSVVTKDGKLVEFRKDRLATFDRATSSIVGIAGNEAVRIPLSDVQQAWVRKTSAGRILGNVLIIGGVAAGFVLFATALAFHDLTEAIEKSCPFVYSYDGRDFVLDAEPYGAAITEGLKRTDWAELSSLRPVDGQYRLLLANELDETQFTDEIKLVAVDHAPGVRVAPDLQGGIHTFSDPIPPALAVDQNGRDIRPFVRANDQIFWLSRLEGRDPGAKGEFRDELTFEFPKPAAAKTVKLLANVWTTQWGSASAGKFLGLFGASLDGSYREVDRKGPLYDAVQAWMGREDLYSLKVWVETPKGWESRTAIFGGAPVITKDKAYVFDIGDIPGDILRIRVRPPVNFWMVNSLAVDYAAEAPVRVTELAAAKAVDPNGRDVRAELAATDGDYHESPARNDRVELVFPAPPVPAGLERTVLLKASGYYRAHIEASGEPQTGLITRILMEPGFAARYSFRKYLEWESSVLARADSRR